MISVVTVPHTGTIYTLELLRRWGVPIERKHLENTDPPPNGRKRFGPGQPGAPEWYNYPVGRRVVCTLRDPILAVISAINRGVPDRMISVDGWAVMAAWWWSGVRTLDNIHFFVIPPTSDGLSELAGFVGARDGWEREAYAVPPMNTFQDPTGLKESYHMAGVVPEHPTIERVVDQLQEMPAVENLFAAYRFDLPWFVHDLDERDEANYNNSLNDRAL